MAENIEIAKIKIGTRARKNLGDVAPLKQSIIDRHGLIHPVAVTKNLTLIAGARRIKACQELGWTTIPAHILDVDKIILGERDENICREDFTPHDRLALAEVCLPAEIIKAAARLKEAQDKGRRAQSSTMDSDKKTESIPSRNRADGEAKSEAAKNAGMSRTTYEKVKVVDDATKNAERNSEGEIVDDDLRKAENEINTVGGKVSKAVAKVKDYEKKEAAVAAAKSHPAGGDIHTGDLSILDDLIDDNSVDLFFTDPPYPEKYIPLFGQLAELAQRKLKPGGLCLVYSGQMFLPQVFDQLTDHLDYWWMCGIRHTGGHLQIWNRKVWNEWKPIIAMVKRTLEPSAPSDEWMLDFIDGGGRDKKYHAWGQDAQEATYWIERLTLPGALIVDPFCGGGAIPVACKATGRRWIASEVDENTAAIARKRLASDPTDT